MTDHDSYVREFLEAAAKEAHSRPSIIGQTFEDETIILDFKKYQECTFNRCKIIVEWGMFGLEGCTMNTCEFIAVNNSPVQGIIKIERMLRDSAMKEDMK